MSDAPKPESTTFSRLWAIGVLVLLAATYPLWSWPPTEFPSVAWLPLPMWIGNAMALGTFVSLVAVVVTPGKRWIWWVVVACLALSITADQHRLQPWAYQTLLYGLVLASRPWQAARPWIIAIAISVYLFSAAGKFDYQFVHTVGSDFVHALTRPVGGVEEPWAVRLAFLLPGTELVMACLLAIPKTRFVGGVLAIAMHVALIGMLGPWSLNHSHGVLAWNALLAAQVYWLFLRRQPAEVEVAEPSKSPVQLIASACIAFALVAPLSERWGYWDHWTSWALYSPHNSRADIQVHRSAIESLPRTGVPFVSEDTDGDGWHDLDIESWSLKQRRVPVYPQGRYQLAVAIELSKQLPKTAIRVTLKSVSDRWTGKRNEEFLIGREELAKAAEGFWLRNRNTDRH